MLQISDIIPTVFANPKTFLLNNLWFYLCIEFIIAAAISGFPIILHAIKSVLPKPPRDLTGDIVLVIGSLSTFGESLIEEFMRNGCSVICVDKDVKSVTETTARITTRARSRMPKETGSEYRETKSKNTGSIIATYDCDLLKHDAIYETARKIKDKVDGLDILVTCSGQPNQDIFDTFNTTLMTHFWSMLGFRSLLLQRDRAHIVEFTPTVSTWDGHLGSKAVIAGFMESLSHEWSNHNTQLTFLTVSLTAELESMMQKEQTMAKDIVEAISRDQRTINVSWSSKMIYRISGVIYSTITRFTQ